jgi:SAM-dependent methyltransferase
MIFSSTGYCPICAQVSEFTADHEWFRDFYLCSRCGTSPRQRAVVQVLNLIKPHWPKLCIHESSPCIPFFADRCPAYSASFFFEDVPLGTVCNGQRCENLECLTFPDESFDIFITQDVLEHVFRPDLALGEISRVLRPGGVHVFTAPKHKDLLKSYPRAKQTEAGEIEYLMPPNYHGNPIGDGRSLVTWDYGADFDDLLCLWSGYLTSNIVIRDRALGIDAEFLDVFVTRKETLNSFPRVSK